MGKFYKIVSLIIVMSMLSGCGGSSVTVATYNNSPQPVNTETPEAQTSEPENTAVNITDMTEETISQLFQLKKDNIISKLGKDYTITSLNDSIMTGTDYERSYEYENLGVIFKFEDTNGDEDSDDLFCICTKPDFTFNGAKSGMSFSEIMDKLGPANVEKSWSGMPSHTVYDISYNFGGFLVRYESQNESGDNCSMTFWKDTETSNYDINDIKIKDLKKEDAVTKSGLTIGDLIIFGYLDRLDLLRHTGEDYEMTGVGPEEYYDGYYYKDKGFTLVFDDSSFLDKVKGSYEDKTDEDTVNYVLFWIEFDDVCLKGISRKMGFKELQSRLGQGKIVKNKISVEGIDTGTEYELSYTIDDFKLSFISYDKNGEGWRCEARYAVLED